MYVINDMDALADNASVLKSALGDFYAVIKCNAYGHGSVNCAKTLYQAGQRHFAVFSLPEALQIRPFIGNSEILILGRTPKEDLKTVSENGLVQTVFSREYVKEILSVTNKIKLHIKIDTGMNRSGFPTGVHVFFDSKKENSEGGVILPLGTNKENGCLCRQDPENKKYRSAGPVAERIFSDISPLSDNILGIYTHFPCADSPDITDTEKRLSLFLKTSKELDLLLGKRLIKHCAASAAAARLPESRLDLCRIGLMLYGVIPENVSFPFESYKFQTCCKPILKPVMSLYGRIIDVRYLKKGETVGYGCVFTCKRDTVIATVDGGYANGIKRVLRGRFSPLISDKKVPVAAICMDRCMLDVTDLFTEGKTVRPGQTVTFFGDGYPVNEMARSAGTISYEILTSTGNENSSTGYSRFRIQKSENIY